MRHPATALKLVSTLLSLVALLAPLPALAEDWPAYRGPHADGISRESAWNPRFPAAGPRVLWKAQVGKGYGAISIADGRAFVTGHADDQETLHCFDARTGAVLWEKSFPAELIARFHSGGPNATPTVDGDQVYILSKDGQLRAYQVSTGNELWSHRLTELLDMELPAWGFASSPVIHGDHLIIDAGTTFALNKTTGQVAWKSKKYKPGYSTPLLFERDGKTLLAALNGYGLVILDAADGAEVAKHRWETQYDVNAASPVLHGDKFFISSGYNAGCALVRFDGSDLTEIYRHRDMRNQMDTSVLIDGRLYGIDGNNGRPDTTLVCMDFETGKVLWRQNGVGCGAVSAAGNTLIVLGERGELITAKASPERFQPISRAQILSDICWTAPVLSHGRLYCRDAAGNLICLDLSEGTD